MSPNTNAIRITDLSASVRGQLNETAKNLKLFQLLSTKVQMRQILRVNSSVLRSRLTDEQLQVALRLTSSHKFKHNKVTLVEAKQIRLGSQNKK